MVKIPPSMADELASWNGGRGIDLDGWIAGAGDFRLAVGYSTIFWPALVAFEGYILHEGFAVESLRRFEASANGNRASVEWVMNHRHIADFHLHARASLTRDKVVVLGETLREMYAARLAWQFPDRPCVVSFDRPDDEDDLVGYQVSFWQKANERQ